MTMQFDQAERFRAKGPSHNSPGRSPGFPSQQQPRAESPTQSRRPLGRAFSPSGSAAPAPGALPQAGMVRTFGPFRPAYLIA